MQEPSGLNITSSKEDRSKAKVKVESQNKNNKTKQKNNVNIFTLLNQQRAKLLWLGYNINCIYITPAKTAQYWRIQTRRQSRPVRKTDSREPCSWNGLRLGHLISRGISVKRFFFLFWMLCACHTQMDGWINGWIVWGA